MLRLEGSRLLVVDDEPRNTRLLADIFTSNGCDVLPLNDSAQVLEAIPRYEPDLIILDVLMPGLSGFELTKEIKSREEWRGIPIILLTALDDRDFCIHGLECGAEDYVAKPFSQRELCARVNNLLMLKKLHDFERRNLQLLKEYDSLSGLPKKEIFLDFTKSMFKDSSPGDVSIGICEVELSNLLIGLEEEVRAHSERVIYQAVVERMLSIFPPGVLLGCFGAGKFGFVLETDTTAAGDHLRKLQGRLSLPVLVDNKQIYLLFSISYVEPPMRNCSWEEDFAKAELALLEAKREGGNTLKRFVPQMNSLSYERWWISQSLLQALHNNQLDMHFQPQVEVANEQLVGLEALIRWHHPKKGFISPAKFIPIAEENGQIYPVGLWVIDRVCQQVAHWKSKGINTRTAINISGAQLHKEEFTRDFVKIFSKYNLAPQELELELTESSIMDPRSDSQLQELRNYGFDIAIDDFGTGYSSLAHLKKYPFNHLKIDRTFICQICDSSDDTAIVKAVLAIARHMGIQVIAEGVETLAQLEKVKQLGCHKVQGYYYSKPLPARDISRIVTSGQFHEGNCSRI